MGLYKLTLAAVCAVSRCPARHAAARNEGPLGLRPSHGPHWRGEEGEGGEGIADRGGEMGEGGGGWVKREAVGDGLNLKRVQLEIEAVRWWWRVKREAVTASLEVVVAGKT